MTSVADSKSSASINLIGCKDGTVISVAEETSSVFISSGITATCTVGSVSSVALDKSSASISLTRLIEGSVSSVALGTSSASMAVGSAKIVTL